MPLGREDLPLRRILSTALGTSIGVYASTCFSAWPPVVNHVCLHCAICIRLHIETVIILFAQRCHSRLCFLKGNASRKWTKRFVLMFILFQVRSQRWLRLATESCATPSPAWKKSRSTFLRTRNSDLTVGSNLESTKALSTTSTPILLQLLRKPFRKLTCCYSTKLLRLRLRPKPELLGELQRSSYYTNCWLYN